MTRMVILPLPVTHTDEEAIRQAATYFDEPDPNYPPHTSAVIAMDPLRFACTISLLNRAKSTSKAQSMVQWLLDSANPERGLILFKRETYFEIYLTLMSLPREMQS